MYPVFQILCVVQVWGMFAGLVSTYNTAEGKPVKSTAYEAVLLAVVPAATFLFHDLGLIRMTLIWGVLIFATYAVWMSILFRKERSFLPRMAGLKASVILVCVLGFALDRAMTRLFPASLDSHSRDRAEGWDVQRPIPGLPPPFPLGFPAPPA